ncbi:hypothetical protein CONCODRAFT_80506 [Conidiobolus coronatus NRRL 28638]|uniref:Arrestin C-terminal-like domain-containing protein n=1 Tax=Conidiobolus coronatus (strain ATCC 28846 / CBS 209.66 / NRRL 28638) TaxID=796925 RepID=A0A137NUC8_CONC2|nr:hypothetical protein CONCODRAFT_80506 [Conidiobolus coronatus NRRL 28638]|eukprot:KXN66369.1 hypothetical protein CONCODRAFT_80506 [Conidiobolus coronatus NRRL 28638]
MVGALLQSPPKLSIHLNEDPIEFRGLPSESSGAVLKGHLQVYLPQPTKIKSLVLSFQGTARTWFLSTPSNSSQNFIDLISHQFTFLESQDKLHALAQGNHMYPFELILPGTLPSSVTSDHLQVIYRLKATLQRNLWRTQTCNKVVNLGRLVMPSNPSLVETLECEGIWNDCINYSLQAEKRILSLGEDFNVNLQLMCNDPSIRIKGVTASLRQVLVIKPAAMPPSIQEHGTINQLLSRAMHRLDFRARSDQQTELHFTLPIPHPCCDPTALYTPHCSTSNDLFEITHNVKLSIAFITSHNETKSFSIKVPIAILSPSWESTTEGLPNYSQHQFTRVIESNALSLPPPSYEVTSGMATPLEQVPTPRRLHQRRSSEASLPSYDDQVVRGLLPHVPINLRPSSQIYTGENIKAN